MRHAVMIMVFEEMFCKINKNIPSAETDLKPLISFW